MGELKLKDYGAQALAGLDKPERLTVVLYNTMVNSYHKTSMPCSPALGDPVRRQIVERLARGPLSAGEIASGFPISQPAISRHLRVLEESGLLERHVLGPRAPLHALPAALKAASGWLDKQRNFWAGRARSPRRSPCNFLISQRKKIL